MSDWNPDHFSFKKCCEEWEWTPPDATSADDEELTRRAAAIRARDGRIAELHGCISRLLLSADATWEEQRMGHDWAEAVAEARAALAGKEEQK